MGMSILDLNQPPQRDALKILLGLLVDKVGLEHGPALYDLGERYRALGPEVQEKGGAHGEVGHKLDVAHGEGAQLQRANRVAVDGWVAAERLQV